MSKWTNNVLGILNAVGFSVLVLVNVGFLLAECPKQIFCKSTRLACTTVPNINGVCPGNSEHIYKNGFGGSDGDTYTCEESDQWAGCVWACPCMLIEGKKPTDPTTCEPDNDAESCQVSQSLLMERVFRGE